MQYYNNILCVEGGWLYNEAQVMSQQNYKQLRRRCLEVLRRGGNGRTALIAYDSLPQRFKDKIIELFGDPYEKTKHISFSNYLEYDTAAQEYYNNYTLDSGDALPEKTIKEYVANATILNACNNLLKSMGGRRKALGGGASKAWDKISDIISELPRHTYPHSLPKNVRRLKQKNKVYLEKGYESLIHGNFCNKNSEKVCNDSKLWILKTWANQVERCTSAAHLLQMYNEMAEQTGWKKLEHEQTIKNYLRDNEHLWWAHRHGELKSKEKFSYQHSTKMPTMRDSLWYSDGTKMNYRYLDSHGKIKTCQVYEVMDAYSEVLLGYHISPTEDYEAQYNAYKMAAQTSGHKPYEIKFDGQGGHKKLDSAGFLSKIARLSIKTQPYNGKSKTIESAFGRFQMQYMKRDWFFTGQNITSKSDESKANREFQGANAKEYPTLDEVKEVYKKRRDQWNNAPHHATGISRMEMYLTSTNPRSPEISMWDMVDMFWMLRPKPVTCSAYGITITEKKTKHTYVVYDENRMPDINWIRNNVDKKFYIKYDPQDMDTVYLYDLNSAGDLRFVAHAEIKIEVARNIQEQDNWEAEYIRSINDLNKQARTDNFNKMQEILEDHNATAEDYGLNTPRISGVDNKKQKGKSKPSNIGRAQKALSNMDEDDEEDDNIYDMM